MSGPGVVDLSFAPGTANALCDLPFTETELQGQAPEEIEELVLTHAQLLSLSSAPEAPINEVLRFVTILQASHNQISTLRGLDAFTLLEVLDLSHNHLRVIDAHAASLLDTLKRLRILNVSFNQMSLLDLNGSLGAPSPRLTGQGSRSSGALASSSESAQGLTSLSYLDLSHNAFIELPDLRNAPYLEVLNMSHNKLDALQDLDTRLPLLSLHTLLLHANLLPHATALVPLCQLASTLAHVQVTHNPFTFLDSMPERGIDEALWWRPFLLWLCPLLTSVDQTELSVGEQRVALDYLFREHGDLSVEKVEYMNAPRKDDLETYLKQESEGAEPPADATAIMEVLMNEDREAEEKEEEELVTYKTAPLAYRKGAQGEKGGGSKPVEKAVDQDDDEGEQGEGDAADVLVPMSALFPGRACHGTGNGKQNGLASHVDPQSGVAFTVESAPTQGDPVVPSGKPTPPSQVLLMAPPPPAAAPAIRGTPGPPNDTSIANGHSNHRQPSKPASLANVVRALQQKTRSLEEVVAVLWRADLARRTAAAIVIQRVVRGALTRMHLSPDDAESFSFIRYQLQQAAAAAASSKRTEQQQYGQLDTRVNFDIAARGPSTRFSQNGPHPNSTATRAADGVLETSGASMQEVLVSMRSLQEVMSNMWIDLEEYRAMADREQRRAATLIQRWFRGYCVRRDYGRMRAHRDCDELSSSQQQRQPCKCAGKTAVLQKEVLELRHEVRELKELLVESARQQRLAAYRNPQQAMDDIVHKHEARVSQHKVRGSQIHYFEGENGGSRSPSATPSTTFGKVSISPERAHHSYGTPGGVEVDDDGHDVSVHGTTAAEKEEAEVTEATDNFPHANLRMHRMPQAATYATSLPDGRSPKAYSSSSRVSYNAPITKQRPAESPSFL